jgi:hypothetical protein
VIIKVGVRTTRLSHFLHLFIVRNILEVSVIHLYAHNISKSLKPYSWQ